MEILFNKKYTIFIIEKIIVQCNNMQGRYGNKMKHTSAS